MKYNEIFQILITKNRMLIEYT